MHKIIKKSLRRLYGNKKRTIFKSAHTVQMGWNGKGRNGKEMF